MRLSQRSKLLFSHCAKKDLQSATFVFVERRWRGGSKRQSKTRQRRLCCSDRPMHVIGKNCTELDYEAIPRFGEFCSCCCLPLMPQLACSILATWQRPLRGALYSCTMSSGDFRNSIIHQARSNAWLDRNHALLWRLTTLLNTHFSANRGTRLLAYLCICAKP